MGTEKENGMSIVEKVSKWAARKTEEELLRKFGGIQTCPWCSQTVQLHGDWSIKAWDRDPMLDVITCGPCGGTSLWRFEMGMIYIGPLSPPKPKHKAVDYYDTSKARLTPTM